MTKAYNLPMADNGGARRRTGRRSLWICAGIAAVGAVAAVLGIWHLPDRMYPGGEVEMGQARAALQGGLLTAAAALTAVAGGLIALDETRQANTETRRANVAADGREREANANTHVRELYIAAIGLLSTETVNGRLGGIYALERVAVDSPADQRTVVEVLSAFVREHTQLPTDTAPAGSGPATDVQAAITVLGRLPVRDHVPRADLTGVNLAFASLEGANLAGAELARANLIGARLSRTDLTDAQLEGADLTGARLIGTDLSGAWLEDANLAGARLNVADLTDSQLEGANLSFASLIRTDFTEARLAGANLTGANLDTADFTRATLDSADLAGVDLASAKGLEQRQVDAARVDTDTRLPAGLVLPASWEPGAGGS